MENFNNENQRRPHVKPGPIKYTKGYNTKRIVSKIINLIIVLLIMFIVALTIFVYIKQPVKTEDGYIVVEPIYEMMNHGDKIVVIENDSYHLFTPIERFLFTQDVYPAKVIAGPYGVIEQVQGKFRVSDGQEIINVNLENPDGYLDLEYIVRKLDENGDAKKDEFDKLIVKEQVLGKLIDEAPTEQ